MEGDIKKPRRRSLLPKGEETYLEEHSPVFENRMRAGDYVDHMNEYELIL